MNRLKQIVIEVEETVVLHSGETRVIDRCPMCEEATEMATPWIAATLHDSTEREIFRLVELGIVHAVEAQRILVCLGCIGKAVTVSPENNEDALMKPV